VKRLYLDFQRVSYNVNKEVSNSIPSWKGNYSDHVRKDDMDNGSIMGKSNPPKILQSP
jgi:hypothetical protein